ncbi:MAG: amino acid permease, partial [Thermodesulfobacteriota bacterium]|nr:amino acid permease [Thermodesulfobacteriota bacterium]
WAGFLLGWVYFFIIMPGSIAALSVALVKYLSFFFPGLNGFASKTSVACLVILVLSFTNYRGIKWGSRVQNFLTTLVIGIVVSLIVLGFFSRAGDLSHFASLSNGDFSLQKFLGPAMIAVIFTYSGWFASAYIASEIKNPERNLPLSLIWGTLIVTVLYLTLNSVYLYALSIDDMKGVINIAQKAGVTLFGPKAGAIVSGVIILATLGSINATIAIAPRVYFAMANDGIFPEMIGRLHSKYHTPHVSIIVQAMLSGFLVFWGTFQQLLSYVVFAMLVSSIATGCSIFILRIRKPDMNRPYKTLGYPFTPILFVGAYMWIAIQILLHKPYEAIIGLAIIATGIPFYFCWKKERN